MAQESSEIGRELPNDTPAAAPPSPATTEIRAQIEHTRAEMSETIDAIQARLRPSRLMTDAKQSVKDATVGRVRRFAAASNGSSGSIYPQRIVDAVNCSPLALAFAGVAATALVARAAMRSHPRVANSAGVLASLTLALAMTRLAERQLR